MRDANKIFLNNLELVLFIKKSSPEFIADILTKYDLVSRCMKNQVKNAEDIVNNKQSLNVLCSKIVVKAVMSRCDNTVLSQYPDLRQVYGVLKQNLSKNGTSTSDIYARFSNEMLKFLGAEQIDNSQLTPNIIKEALETFGLDSIDLNDIDMSDINGSEEEAPEGLFDSDEHDGEDEPLDIGEISEEELMAEQTDYEKAKEEEAEAAAEAAAAQNKAMAEAMAAAAAQSDDEDDDAKVEKTAQVEKDLNEQTNDKYKNTDELKKALESEYSSLIDSSITDIVNKLMLIYGSSFDGIPHSGVIIDNGVNEPLIAFKKGTSNLISKHDSLSINEMCIVSAIKKLGDDYKYLLRPYFTRESNGMIDKADKDNTIPNIETLKANKGVCVRMHSCFQSGWIDETAGSISLRKWITETRLKKDGVQNVEEWIRDKNGRGGRITNKKLIRSWYTWALKNYILDSMVKCGLRPSLDDATREEFFKIMEAVSNNILNVITESERIKDSDGKGVNIDITIGSHKKLDAEKILAELNKEFSKFGVTVKQKAHSTFEESNGCVVVFSIILNSEKANSTQQFAYEIVDNLRASGNIPTWDHALLGKKEDGTYLFWNDFMGSAEPYKRCYTIYAGSRSGKGIMTSTLIASALSDGKQVFYTDGKPENGATLGMIAWSQGKEAYVFDGQKEGSAPFSGNMEKYTFGVRDKSELTQYLSQYPKELFEDNSVMSNSATLEFLGVMRYLKSLALCANIILGRAKGTLPSDQWNIWIFDECTSMSKHELEIRKRFANYVRKKTGLGEVNADKDAKAAFIDFKKATPFLEGGEKYDAGVDYIYKWCKWTSTIRTMFLEAAVISLGKASTNIIFIFQEATWIAEQRDITTIAKVVALLRSTKIVGRNALAKECGDYGDGTTMNKGWYTTVNGEGKWWAISSAADLRKSEVTLFKPYNVFTIPLKDVDAGIIDPNPNPADAKKYLAGYVQSLCSNAADVLQSAYTYADECVKTLGFASSLKEFINNAAILKSGDATADLELLRREYGEDLEAAGLSDMMNGEPLGGTRQGSGGYSEAPVPSERETHDSSPVPSEKGDNGYSTGADPSLYDDSSRGVDTAGRPKMTARELTESAGIIIDDWGIKMSDSLRDYAIRRVRDLLMKWGF